MYTAGGSVTETAEACRKLLLAQGWQPYGKAGDTLFFKQNALRLTVTVTAAPALGGKTSVSFSAEQLSADLPAPSDTVQLQYTDSTKQVLFDTKDSADAIVVLSCRMAISRLGNRARGANECEGGSAGVPAGRFPVTVQTAGLVGATPPHSSPWISRGFCPGYSAISSRRHPSCHRA
jgi:hypothetical protein